MFHIFDKLILLSEGNALYSGHANEAIEYFQSLHFTPQIAMNPADFLLDLATGMTEDITVPEELERLVHGMMNMSSTNVDNEHHHQQQQHSRIGGNHHDMIWSNNNSNLGQISEEFQRDLVVKVWSLNCLKQCDLIEFHKHVLGCKEFLKRR